MLVEELPASHQDIRFAESSTKAGDPLSKEEQVACSELQRGLEG